jgi:hypothetical protein
MGTNRFNNIQYSSRSAVYDFHNLTSSLIERISYWVHGLINAIRHAVDSIVHSISDPIDDVAKGLGRGLGGCRGKVANNSSSLRLSFRMADGL